MDSNQDVEEGEEIAEEELDMRRATLMIALFSLPCVGSADGWRI